MKIAPSGAIFKYHGELVHMIGWIENRRVLLLQTVRDRLCPHCKGSLGQAQEHVVEDAPIFQDGAEPVPTLEVR